MKFSATKISLLLLIISVIILNFYKIDVAEPLKTISLMVVSFYFWQKKDEDKWSKEQTI